MITQYIVVNFDNCGDPIVYKLTSDKPITRETVLKYLKSNDFFNEDRDTFHLIGKVREHRI